MEPTGGFLVSVFKEEVMDVEEPWLDNVQVKDERDGTDDLVQGPASIEQEPRHPVQDEKTATGEHAKCHIKEEPLDISCNSDAVEDDDDDLPLDPFEDSSEESISDPQDAVGQAAAFPTTRRRRRKKWTVEEVLACRQQHDSECCNEILCKCIGFDTLVDDCIDTDSRPSVVEREASEESQLRAATNMAMGTLVPIQLQTSGQHQYVQLVNATSSGPSTLTTMTTTVSTAASTKAVLVATVMRRGRPLAPKLPLTMAPAVLQASGVGSRSILKKNVVVETGQGGMENPVSAANPQYIVITSNSGALSKQPIAAPVCAKGPYSAAPLILTQQPQTLVSPSSAPPATLFVVTAAAASAPAARPANRKSKKNCKCHRTRCLKLYCECFANGLYCNDCNCVNCYNNLDHELERRVAVRKRLERNPMAFTSKVERSPVCNCRRSSCRNFYCQCYEARVPCSSKCGCAGCHNSKET